MLSFCRSPLLTIKVIFLLSQGFFLLHRQSYKAYAIYLHHQMDQIVLEGLQHLWLTKEEEEDIAILTMSKSDLMEECALSLFGKLLSNRQQNQRALKSTLKAACKMESELRIIDVGKDIFQFKFTSKYQMEWVERNGLGISTIICSCFADGKKIYLYPIFPSPIPPFGSKFRAFLSKIY